MEISNYSNVDVASTGLIEDRTRSNDVSIGPFLARHVWPLSGTATPDLPLASTFGPRCRGVPAYAYDFHRGIDIEAQLGTPVYAIADGEVRMASYDRGYDMQIVQIRHRKPNLGSTAARNPYYYSNYMHLSSIAVNVDDDVRRGDLIGYTGINHAGFSHLHFEVRDGGIHRKHCIHPLSVLPYLPSAAPTIGLRAVDLTDPLNLRIDLRVTLQGKHADLNRIELSVYHVLSDAAVMVERQVCDFQQWNRAYAPLESPDAYLGHPSFNGIELRPGTFSSSSNAYTLDVSFYDVLGAKRLDHLLIEARAFCVGGTATRVRLI